MDIEKIMKNLSENLTITLDVDLNQKDINKLINYCIKNDFREKAWRIALSCSDFDYTKLALYYIKVKDDWYLTELLYVIGHDSFAKKIYKKVIKSNDKEFVNKVIKMYMTYYFAKDEKELENILDKF